MNKSDIARANKEGWAIFEARGSQQNEQGNWPYQLQRNDDGPLEDDEAAHDLCVKGAKENKKHCLAALRFLRQHSKPELDLIYRSCLQGDAGWRESLRTHDTRLDNFELSIFGKVVSRG